jgi:DNA-binding LytR/AlgR family response regulator
MKLNITICDDEAVEIKYVNFLVRKWIDLNDVVARISCFDSAESLLFAYEDDKKADILLLDIQMTGMDGVTLAKTIRAQNKEVQIIFITGYMECIADGYDVEALHYLLKPVTEDKLFSILDRAVEKLARSDRALFINHGGENVRIPFYEIRYLEVLHNYVTIHAGSDYKVKKTLSELESELDDGFFKTGRSYIVNLRYVRKSTSKEVFLDDETMIPLSRGLYHALNRALIDRL